MCTPHPLSWVCSPSSASVKCLNPATNGATGSHPLDARAGASDFWMCKQVLVAFLSRHCCAQVGVRVSIWGSSGCTSSVKPGGARNQGHLEALEMVRMVSGPSLLLRESGCPRKIQEEPEDQKGVDLCLDHITDRCGPKDIGHVFSALCGREFPCPQIAPAAHLPSAGPVC